MVENIDKTVTAGTGAIISPLAPITSAAQAGIAGIDPLKDQTIKKGLSPGGKAVDPKFDSTDNDINYTYELTKEAIRAGAKVADIDLMQMAPIFQKEQKIKAGKYRNQRIMDWISSGSFMLLVYFIIEKLFV